MVETTLKHRAKPKKAVPDRPANISVDLAKWMDGIDTFIGESHWHDYENEIRSAINDYDRNLRGIAGYRPPDFSLMKAIMWAENDPSDATWNSRPMHIGNSGDPGLEELLKPNGVGTVIIPQQWQKGFSSRASSNSQDNIRAAIAYVLVRASNSDLRSVVGSNSRIFEVEVKKGDTLE